MEQQRRWILLNNRGNIPQKHTCPYDFKCPNALVWKCPHKGEKHPCEFSCSTARAFDIGVQHRVVMENKQIALGRCHTCGLLLTDNDSVILYPHGKIKCRQCAKTPTDQYPVVD